MVGFRPSLLFAAPEFNPLNHKARSIPALNPVNVYGRVFTFAWFGFLVAFWSWYAFPPLLHDIIRQDLGLAQSEVANSNIIALVATLLVRLVAGPACDKFGPRLTFAGCLIAGAIPTFLVGAVTNVSGLYAIRFFIGILGGSFVPCQVWTTGFFDKNVIGTANALTGGLGNLGGGITYFIMPAVYQSLVSDQGLAPRVAWRVAFVVPGIVITVTAIAMLLLCPDTPTGKWADRGATTNTDNLIRTTSKVVDVPTRTSHPPISAFTSPSRSLDEKQKRSPSPNGSSDTEAQVSSAEATSNTAREEVIQKPTFKEVIAVSFSLQTLVCGASYFNSFGGELAINSILGAYYERNFSGQLTYQQSSNWAAMFGLLNGITRPLGGLVSDLVYSRTHSLWAKKLAIITYGIISSAFLIAIGLLDPQDQSTMFGLVASMAFFLEGGNGLVFGLVPHVHPYANGVVSGFTGACGNLGGVVFAIIFRYNGANYARPFWLLGVIGVAMYVATSWIRPVPKSQVSGR